MSEVASGQESGSPLAHYPSRDDKRAYQAAVVAAVNRILSADVGDDDDLMLLIESYMPRRKVTSNTAKSGVNAD